MKNSQFWSAAATILLSTPLMAQQVMMPPSVPYARAHGEATVSMPPDRVQMDVGVISQAASSEAAAELNGKQSGAVIDRLHTVVPASSISTVNFSVNPNYEYPKGGGTPTILGYTANNTVRVDVDDPALVRKVIEVATRSGASTVNRLNYVLRDESKARAEALGKAADRARSGAEALAASLHAKLGRILRLEEEEPVIVSPGREVEFAAGKAQAVDAIPVAPGKIDIHASVSLTFELLQ